MVPWPFTVEPTDDGDLHVATRTYDRDARHGAVPLARALGVTGEAVAMLALDPALAGFDPARALFLDTETTGLAGGAGTLAFLVGAGWFEDGAFRMEQVLLADLDTERPLLSRLAARIAAASALVTFNGKSFDLPLLRSRFVMARVPAAPERPHLDLLHVARRIYGARVARCTLTTLERDVLGFTRVDDIPGAEVPARYLRYLREREREREGEGEGGRDAVLPVVAHNAWDIAALVALVGELGARVARADAEGRFEPRDLVGLARTTLRAGHHARAADLASEAAARAAAVVDRIVARDAHVLAATGHRRARDPVAAAARLLDALVQAPDDPALHLALARCYERDLALPERALAHAVLAAAAEEPAAHARRIARLRRTLRRGTHRQLKLPGL